MKTNKEDMFPMKDVFKFQDKKLEICSILLLKTVHINILIKGISFFKIKYWLSNVQRYG